MAEVTSSERAELRAVQGTLFGVAPRAEHHGPGVRSVVFLKGCVLQCVSCLTPEARLLQPQVFWYVTRCMGCNACHFVCPEQMAPDDRMLIAESGRCRSCGRCASICPSEALEVRGAVWRAGEVLYHLLRAGPPDADRPGITAAGGEPLMQRDFLHALFALFKEAGYQTAVETSGLVPWGTIASLLAVTDVWLYEVRHAGEAKHRRETGVPNDLILENLGRLAQSGAEVVVRHPFLVGRTGDPGELRELADALLPLGLRKIAIIPHEADLPEGPKGEHPDDATTRLVAKRSLELAAVRAGWRLVAE